MKPALSAAVPIASTAWAAWCQAAAVRPEFDVASLKPVVLDGADTYMANPGAARNIRLRADPRPSEAVNESRRAGETAQEEQIER